MAKVYDDERGIDWDRVVAGSKHVFTGTKHGDDLVGTKRDDVFHIEQGGNDSVDAGKGNDTIYVGAELTARDRIDGGAGTDVVVVDGQYDTLTLGAKTLRDVETLQLLGDHPYNLEFANTIHTQTGNLTIAARDALALNVDGSHLTGVSLSMYATAFADTLFGGAGADLMQGSGGADYLAGGAAGDVYYYVATSDSTAAAADTIDGFQHGVDLIALSTIDADTATDGNQAFHFDSTPGHTGDLFVQYDFANSVTLIEGFTDSDATPDLVIKLAGIHTDLTASDFNL